MSEKKNSRGEAICAFSTLRIEERSNELVEARCGISGGGTHVATDVFSPIRRSELGVPSFLVLVRNMRSVLISAARMSSGRAN
jgi:hypothetical protein